MSRALLIIVAVLSAVLAAVLDAPLLYGLALVLLLAAGGLWVAKMKGRFDITKPKPSGYSAGADEDLSSYGILEIRPKARNGLDPGTERREEESGSGGQPGLFEAPEPAERVEVPEETERPEGSKVVEREPAKTSVGTRLEAFVESNHRSSPLYQMISVAESLDANVLGPCLESLASALKANTVVLVSNREESYRILAIVSQNAYARGGGVLPVTSVEPFASPGKGRVRVQAIGSGKWDAADLKYYRGEIAVREIARVSIDPPSPDEEILLVADSVKKGVLAGAQAKHLLKEYARLLATLLGVEPEEPAVSVVRPRREIIGEEMDDARSEGHPLALALVLLNRADDFQDPDSVAEVEEELASHLSELADGVRVEKFGDLMFGVFHRSDVREVESWGSRLQAELANSSGLLSGGVSVGVAMMTDRHVGPAELRADAAAALQEALESGACTILA